MIQVEFICSPGPRQVVTVALSLPDGATLQHAMRMAEALPELQFLGGGSWDAGLWGRRSPMTTPLKDGDRVEAYRPLHCDPKEARRLRYRQSPKVVRRVVPKS